jgi:hypothetical protein
VSTGVLGRDQLRELEVLATDDVPAPERTSTPPKKRRRRWWWLVPVIAVLALAVAFPVRAAVGRAELRGLEGRWRASQSLINDGFAEITRLRAAAGPSFTSAIPAVFQEQADDLQRMLNATRAQLVLDPPLAGLRRQMAQALQREVTDLRRDWHYWQRPDGSPEPADLTTMSFDAQSRVERALSAQLKRLSLQPAEPRSVPPLRAAVAALARLNRIADQPIGARLVASTAAGLFRIDIDKNRVDPLELAGVRPIQILQLLPRAGFVVIGAVGRNGPESRIYELYVVPSTFTGPVTDLGAIDALVAGDRPDTYWVRRPDGTAAELDGNGQVVRGPVPVELPYGSQLVGGTSSGLVIAIRAPSGQAFSLEIINPNHPAAPARVVGSGVPLVTCGDRLVWFENDEPVRVHLTDVISGVDRTIDPGPQVWPDGFWACSPDNTKVAGAWFSLTNKPLDIPGVIDLSTGKLQLTTGGGLDTQPGTTSMAWTYDGDRVFFLGTLSSSGGRQDPMTFRPGDPDVVHLRLPGYQLDAMAPLP